MERWISRIISLCVSKRIICEDEAVWFRYGIEKRFLTFAVGIPFGILAVFLTKLSTAISFYFTFYWIRSKSNGFHASSVKSCLLISLSLEILFCAVVYRFLNIGIMILCAVCGVISVFVLAPLKNSNLPMTNDERKIVKWQVRHRILTLTVAMALTYQLGWVEISKGISLGIAMASFMLCLPYIIQKGI